MSLLPRAQSHAYGGALPEDPALLQRQRRQQSESAMGGALSAGAGMIPGVGGLVAGGLQIGQQLGSAISAGSKDENGLYKENTAGARIAAGLETALNPTKALSTVIGLISGKRKLSDPFGVKADTKLHNELEAKQQRAAIDQQNQAGQQVYGQLTTQPGSYRRGGLLPTATRRYANGGTSPGPGKQPLVTGTYSTKDQVQSQNIQDRNATAQYLDQFKNNPQGLQQAYGEAINDITHPVTGKPVSYAQLKTEFGHNGQALYASPAYQKGGYKSSGEYLQAVFNEGQQRLNQRGVQQPQTNAFAPAVNAVNDVRRQQGISGPQVGAYSTAREATAAFQQYGYQARGTESVSAAPGMTVRPQGVVQAPAARRTVVPPQGVASRRRGGLLPGK